MLDRAYKLAEQLLARVDRIIELLEQIVKERDRVER